ncbi:TPA: dihydroneopterin aldolase [bacterium]|nr:dihydroneopterin aldolase [bacterium]
MEKLVIKGLKLWGYHGIEEKEKKEGQEFIFDIELIGDFPKEDSLEKTIDYLEVIKEVERINKGSCLLIETLARKIKDNLSSKFGQEVNVYVKKIPKINYSLEYVSAEIYNPLNAIKITKK